MIKKPALVLACLLAAPFTGSAAPSGISHPHYGVFGIDLTARALNVKPGDDFWNYANGTWARQAKIDAKSEIVGVSRDMRDRLDKNVRSIIDDMAAKPAYGAAGHQIGALYRSWMNETIVEARGTASLTPYLARVDSVNTSPELQTLFITPGYASPLSIGADINPSNPNRYIVTIGQGKLGMPRDYYLSDGPNYDRVRAAYRAYVLALQQLSGIPDAIARTDSIIALETAIAKVQWSNAASRDLDKMHRYLRGSDLETSLPGFDWNVLLSAYGLDADTDVLVQQDSALVALSGIMASIPLQTWKDYLRYRFVADHAAYLPKPFADQDFAFNGTALLGVQSPPERWRSGVQLVGNTLGNAIGRIYAERYFSASAVQQIQELVTDVRAAYRDRITAAVWMDASTRRRALAKLDALEAQVGAPDHFADESTLLMDPDDLLGNMVRAEAFAYNQDIKHMHEPVDPNAWVALPQQMNAYYDQHRNAIVFPASILQPPLFDPAADAAVNYGAIGVLIGHEMGHAFDDQGRQFGPDGRIENWWSEAAAQGFAIRSAALVRQYDNYEALPGLHVNGNQTLGENMADLSGVEAAYIAYQRYQKRHGKAPRIQGLTGEQRFFLAYAQGRRTLIKDSTLRELMAVDNHAPTLFRVNGVLRNVDAWYRAFDVRPGDALYVAPNQRIRIW